MSVSGTVYRQPYFCRARDCRACLEAEDRHISGSISLRRRSDSDCASVGQHGYRAGLAVVESDPRVQQVIRTMLEATDEFRPYFFFSTAAEALLSIPDLDVSMVLVAVTLPDRCGIKLTREMLARKPELLVIITSALRDVRFIQHAVAAGIAGFILKPFNVSQCFATLRFVSLRRIVVSRRRESLAFTSGSPERGRLNAREELVLRCLAEGLLHKEVEERLGLSHAILKKLIRRTFRKLKAHNRMEAVNNWRRLSEKNAPEHV